MALGDYLFRILRPWFWEQAYPTDDCYSAAVERAIDAEAGVEVGPGSFTVKLGGVPIWVGNYPYRYGTLWPEKGRPVMPTARVRKKLREYIKLRLPGLLLGMELPSRVVIPEEWET